MRLCHSAATGRCGARLRGGRSVADPRTRELKVSSQFFFARKKMKSLTLGKTARYWVSFIDVGL